MASPNGEIRYVTEKQVRYLMYLLRHTGHIRSPFIALGVPPAERNGSIEIWLRSRTIGEASALIDRLKHASL